jgi:hypothetical protein
MSIELTKMQQQALDKELDQPPRMIDPRTNEAYILVRAEDYENLRELWEEERQRKGIHAVALRNAIGRMEER